MHTTMLLAVVLLSVTLPRGDSRYLEQYESVPQNISGPSSAPESAGPSAVASPAAAALNTTQVVEAVQKALKEPAPHIINLRTEYNASGTSIAVGDSYVADTLTVQVRTTGGSDITALSSSKAPLVVAANSARGCHAAVDEQKCHKHCACSEYVVMPQPMHTVQAAREQASTAHLRQIDPIKCCGPIHTPTYVPFDDGL